MILYSVNYSGPISSYEWSIVTIHKTLEGAKNALEKYIENQKKNGNEAFDYCIIEIDTDSSEDCIFDCEYMEEDIYDKIFFE